MDAEVAPGVATFDLYRADRIDECYGGNEKNVVCTHFSPASGGAASHLQYVAGETFGRPAFEHGGSSESGSESDADCNEAIALASPNLWGPLKLTQTRASAQEPERVTLTSGQLGEIKLAREIYLGKMQTEEEKQAKVFRRQVCK
jgi:hypothetical protein